MSKKNLSVEVGQRFVYEHTDSHAYATVIRISDGPNSSVTYRWDSSGIVEDLPVEGFRAAFEAADPNDPRWSAIDPQHLRMLKNGTLGCGKLCHIVFALLAKNNMIQDFKPVTISMLRNGTLGEAALNRIISKIVEKE